MNNPFYDLVLLLVTIIVFICIGFGIYDYNTAVRNCEAKSGVYIYMHKVCIKPESIIK